MSTMFAMITVDVIKNSAVPLAAQLIKTLWKKTYLNLQNQPSLIQQIEI